MSTSLLKHLFLVILLSACASSKNSKDTIHEDNINETVSGQPEIAEDKKPQSLMDLPQTPNGGFVLAPGYYEAEFKTYCLQPGTPDPRPGDAYLQGPVTGHRKEIVESILLNSRERSEIPQRNIQLLLWSVVSGADFNKLPNPVQADAMKLLTPKQVFQLKGGVVGVLKKVSYASGVLKANNDMQRLFETGASTYESFERLAVLREPSQIKRKGVRYDQWYKQKENYYIRYFPASYQKVKIQLYVQDGLLDADNKVNGEYIVFDPTGQQASPAFTNAQRLGIGAPVIDIVRVIIQVNKGNKAPAPKKMPGKKHEPVPGDKQFLQ
ncbi:MAG: hypothetical protein JNN00_10665 [Chitinophagaceae bacterium]|nr:hypothetical protein [Chitinophagaceae bacterium]